MEISNTRENTEQHQIYCEFYHSVVCRSFRIILNTYTRFTANYAYKPGTDIVFFDNKEEEANTTARKILIIRQNWSMHNM